MRLVLVLTLLCCWLALYAPARAADVCYIRVLLTEDAQRVTVGGELEWSDGSRSVGSSSQPIEVRRVGGEVKVTFGDRGVQAARLIAEPRSGYVRYGGRQYRGHLELFGARNGNVALINVVPLDDYLLGVVPYEMPHTWPMPALEAQSVAARTYAISRIVNRHNESFDVVATVMDQVYRGVDGEQSRTSEAVRNTAGRIVTYDGKPIVAYYCSDAGGCTKCGTEPYLQSVPIESPDSPHNQWSVSLSREQLAALVTRTGGRIGSPSSVEAQLDGASGHLVRLTVVGDKGRHSITGPKLREAIGLRTMKSTRAWVEIVGQNTPKPEVIARPNVTSPLADSRPRQEVIAVQLDANAVVAASGGPKAVAGFAAGRAVQSISLPSYSRPWVAYAGGVAGIKMRSAFVSNGVDTVPVRGDLLAAGLAAADLTMALAQPMGNDGSVVLASHRQPERRPAPRATSPPAPVEPKSISGPVGSGGIVIHGRGYGHGMGLSQWGAKTLAERGLSYDQILAYFYSGVQLSEVDGRLRVRAAAGRQPASGRKPTAEKRSDDDKSVPVFYQPFAPGRK